LWTSPAIAPDWRSSTTRRTTNETSIQGGRYGGAVPTSSQTGPALSDYRTMVTIRRLSTSGALYPCAR
jgi:hypothetical protein